MKYKKFRKKIKEYFNGVVLESEKIVAGYSVKTIPSFEEDSVYFLIFRGDYNKEKDACVINIAQNPPVYTSEKFKKINSPKTRKKIIAAIEDFFDIEDGNLLLEERFISSAVSD